MELTSSNIKEPGLSSLPLGVERHVVNGGGITGIQIFPEDEIEIINDEGNQICEISVFNKDGKSELEILNLKENKDSNEIKKILSKKDESSLITAYQLKKRNLDIEKSKSAIVFNKDATSREKIKLISKDKCYCIFSAPGPGKVFPINVRVVCQSKPFSIFLSNFAVSNATKSEHCLPVGEIT